MRSSLPCTAQFYCNYPSVKKKKTKNKHDMICSLYIQSLKTMRPWRSLQSLWMSCRNVTVKPLPFLRRNIPRLLSDSLHVSSPSLTPSPYLKAGECHVDNVNSWYLWGVARWRGRCLRPAVLGEVTRGWPRVRGCCQWPRRTGSAWAVCLSSSVLPSCSHLGLWLPSRWAMD